MLLQPRPPDRWKPAPWPWSWAALCEPYDSIARSCAFLLPLWESGGNPRCVATGTAMTRTAGTSLAAGPFGPALSRTDGTLDHLTGPAGFIPISTPNSGYTIFGVANPASSSAAAGSGSLFLTRRTVPWVQYGLMFNIDQTGAGGDGGGAGILNAYQQNSNSGNPVCAMEAGSMDGRWHAYGSRLSGNTTTIWRDGLVRGTNTTAPPTLYDAAQAVYVGGLNASGYGFIGGVALVAAFNRALADWEMRALHDNPMGLVIPAVSRKFFLPPDPPGPGPTTGTSAATLPMADTSAAGTRTIPARTATSASATPRAATTATATRTIPARTAAGSSTLPSAATAAAATRAIPARTATSAGTLPVPATTVAASRTIPNRTGAAASAVPVPATVSAGTRTIPARTATGASTLPSVTTVASAVRLPPPRVASAVAVLPIASTTATATRTIPARTATGTATTPKAATAATAVRTIPARTATGASTLAVPTGAATAFRAAPGIAGASASATPRAAMAAAGTRAI